MKLKREDGYWSLKPSTIRDYLRGSTKWKKVGRVSLIVSFFVFLFLSVYFLAVTGFAANHPVPLVLGIGFAMAIAIPLVIANLVGRAVYGSWTGWDKRTVELPRVEFHTLGTCRNYGKRIMSMVKELNVADHYIFLLNFHNLFYHDDHRLENPDRAGLNAIARAVRILPERRRSTVWTKNPFQAISGGIDAGKEAAEEQQADYYSKKVGALPEPSEAVAIITKEYLPELTREFDRDTAMLIAVILCTANNYTGVFPYDGRVVTEKEAVEVATNPTRENVVNYCLKFKGIAAEEPVVRRRGLMED